MSIVSRIKSLWSRASSLPMVRALTWPGNGTRFRPTHSTVRSFPRWLNQWVFTCADRNAVAVARRILRLYNSSPTKFRKSISRDLERSERMRLKSVNSRRYTDETVEVDDHPFLDIIDRPNPLLDRFGLLWLTTVYAQVAGEAFWYLSIQDGELREIWPLPSQFVSPVMGKATVFESYELRMGGFWKMFPAANIVHFRPRPSPIDTLSAFGPLRGVLESAETMVRIQEYQRALFDNMAMPSFIISPAEGITPTQAKEMQAGFSQDYAGWRKAGKGWVAPGKVDVHELSFNHRELEFEKGKLAVRDEVCAGFGIPISVINSDGSTFSNMHDGLYLWGSNTVDPLGDHICEKINTDIMPLYRPRLGDGIPVPRKSPWWVCMDTSVPEDDVRKTDKVVKLSAGAIITINEARREMGEDPVPWGEQPYIPATLRTPLQLAAESAAVIDVHNMTLEGAAQSQLIASDNADLAVGLDRAKSIAELTNALATAMDKRDLALANMLRNSIAAQLGQNPPPDLTEEDLGPTATELAEQQAALSNNAGNQKPGKPAGADGGDDGKTDAPKSVPAKPREKAAADVLEDEPGPDVVFSKSALYWYPKLAESTMQSGVGAKAPFKGALSQTFAEFEREVIGNIGNVAPKRITVDVAVLFKRAKWIEKFERKAFPYLRIAFDRGSKLGAGDLVRASIEPMLLKPERITALLTKYLRGWASSIVDLTGEQLAKALEEGLNAGEPTAMLSQRVADVYGKKKDSHSEMIARTEVNTALNGGAAMTWAESGIKRHQWVTSVNPCEFCEAMGDKIVDIGTAFVKRGDSIQGTKGGSSTVAYRDVLHPTLHPRCVCTLLPVIE